MSQAPADPHGDALPAGPRLWAVARANWPFAVVATIVVAVLSPALRSEFSLIDDHEVVEWLGPGKRLPAGEVPPLCVQVAQETSGRFRPAYYVLRVVETWLDGDSPLAWHAVRLFLALTAAAAVYAAARALLPPLPAALVCLSFFSGPQSEIWVRLGPAETYACVFASLGVCAVAWLLGRGHWRPSALAPGLFLLSLAGLTKESFLPLLPAALAFLYVVLPLLLPGRFPIRSLLTARDVVALLLLAAAAVGPALGAAYVVRRYGHVYATREFGTSAVGRCALLMTQRWALSTGWVVPVAAAGLSFLPLPRPAAAAAGPRLGLWLALLAAGFLLIALPQAIVYQGQGLEGRYLTPGNLFVLLAVSLSYWRLYSLAPHGLSALLRAAALVVPAGLALLACLSVRGMAVEHTVATRRVHDEVREVVRLTEEYPDRPVVLHAEDARDYEPILSAAVYLWYARGTPPRLFLRVPPGWGRGPVATLDDRVRNELARLAADGGDRFLAASEFPDGSEECIDVFFHVRRPPPGPRAVCIPPPFR